MTVMTFDQAVREIRFLTSVTPDTKIELYSPETNQTREIELWRADVSLVQSEGIVMVAGRKFRNNGQVGVEMH